MKHEFWSSRLAFLMAACGASVGLGNVWRFPYLAGENGGGAFVLIYILIVALLCIPLVLSELVLGRRGGGSAITSMQKLIKSAGASRAWNAIGWLSILIPLVGMSYYSIVAGWMMDYIVAAILGNFSGLDADSSAAAFASLTENPWLVFFWQTAFVGITVWIVARGIRQGLEVALKWMMPSLFGILVFLVIFAMFTADFSKGFQFLFQPDWTQVSGNTILLALGQALFSVAVGVGAMITYGAYLSPGESLPKSAGIIAGIDTTAALMAGLAIFPLVFAFGLDPAGGPGLIFVTLPIAFGQMTGGAIVGGLFFILMFFAALSSAIGMLEPAVSYLEERKGVKRVHMAMISGAVAWFVGIGPALSFNILKDFQPLGFVNYFAGKTLFDLLDFLIANLLLPVNALLIVLFAGWVMSRHDFREEVALGKGGIFVIWYSTIRFVIPVALAAIFYMNFS